MESKVIFTHYKVLSNGWVKSLPRRGTRGGMLKPTLDSEGFLRVNISVGGRVVQKKVHRLVAIAFLHNPKDYPDVLHKNGDLSDNRVENLEWGSRRRIGNRESYIFTI